MLKNVTLRYRRLQTTKCLNRLTIRSVNDSARNYSSHFYNNDSDHFNNDSAHQYNEFVKYITWYIYSYSEWQNRMSAVLTMHIQN